MRWQSALSASLGVIRRYRAIGLWAGLAASLAALVAGGISQWQTAADNRIIVDLQAGRDIEVDASARPAVVLARALYLVHRDRIDSALPLVETLAAANADGHPQHPAQAVDALYSIGNARVRQGLDLIERGGLSDGATAPVRLAKDAYLRALRLEPQHWDAKYNLDVASRLVRDFPVNEQEGEDDLPDPMTKLWTELPGVPRGLP